MIPLRRCCGKEQLRRGGAGQIPPLKRTAPAALREGAPHRSCCSALGARGVAGVLHARRGVTRRAGGDTVRRRRVEPERDGPAAGAAGAIAARGGGRVAKSFIVSAAASAPNTSSVAASASAP